MVGVDPDGLTEGGEDSEDRAAMKSTSMPAGHTSADIDLVSLPLRHSGLLTCTGVLVSRRTTTRSGLTPWARAIIRPPFLSHSMWVPFFSKVRDVQQAPIMGLMRRLRHQRKQQHDSKPPSPFVIMTEAPHKSMRSLSQFGYSQET